jgi:hypothetical protein
MNPTGTYPIRPVKILCLILALLACALKSSADPTTHSLPQKIGATEATNYFDQTMTVTGTVAQVTVRPSIVFLNMDHPYPNSPFTLVIFSANAPKFGDLKSLNGKAVEATGEIKKYHDKPEMVLESTNQLKILP